MRSPRSPEPTTLGEPRWSRVVTAAPIVLTTAYALALILPPTRQVALRLLEENHAIERLTFVAFLAAGAVGAPLCVRLKNAGAPWLAAFVGFFAFGCFLVAMEEIAWGQWLFGFETPSRWRSINAQEELTLHNVEGLHGHSEMLRLAFGIGGLVGVALGRHPAWRAIAAPKPLLSWFAIISTHAALDVYNDIWPIEPRFDFFVQRTSELIEMLIAVSALLFVLFLRSRQARAQA